MRILYFSPSSHGGIADYAHEQANALVNLGTEVTFLCTTKYPKKRGNKYRILPLLQEMTLQKQVNIKILKAAYYTLVVLKNINILVKTIKENDFKYVLFGTYSEYAAPLWAWRLRKLTRKGVIFGAVVHDPVRDFILGPFWWHRWSIASGYSFLREAFVHEAIDLNTIRPMPKLRTTIIPHGQYTGIPTLPREEIRRSFEVPIGAKLMLFFGHIHPHRKNYDLAIRALNNFPGLYLIIAGEDTSLNHSIVKIYKDLANKLKVADRCRWVIRFIILEEAANFYEAADVVLLLYKKNYYSASGILSLATHCHKACIASGGVGPLQTVVKKYDLGIWVEPDDLNSLIGGIRKFFEDPPNPKWEKYSKDNSWELNAELVIKSFVSY